MDNPMKSTQEENPPVTPQRTGTVQDVRPVPPLIPKDLPANVMEKFEELNQFLQNPQVGELTDNLTQERKTFRANLTSPLKKDDVVYYKNLPNPSSHNVVVTGRRRLYSLERSDRSER